MRALLVAVLLLSGGCANYHYRVGTGSLPAAAPVGGTVVTSSSSGFYATTTSASAALFFAVMFGAIAGDDLGQSPPPELDPQRSIHDQDCTRPVALTGGNLRCR